MFILGPLYIIYRNNGYFWPPFKASYPDGDYEFELVSTQHFDILFANLTFAFTVFI